MITAERTQMYFMPPSIQEWVPEEALAWVVLDVVEHLDVSGFRVESDSARGGRPAYDPRVMVNLPRQKRTRGQATLTVRSYCSGDIEPSVECRRVSKRSGVGRGTGTRAIAPRSRASSSFREKS
jgi:hypothetical protein